MHVADSATQIKVTSYLYEGKHEQIIAYSKTNIETVFWKQDFYWNLLLSPVQQQAGGNR
jgi:hypothetical protein